MMSNIIQNVNRSFLRFSNLNRLPYSVNRLVDCHQFDHVEIHSKRTLFTDEVLGVDRFIDFKQKVIQRFGNNKEKFIERFTEHINEESSMILSEDLKNLIFLCENDPKDMDLLKTAIQKFEKQNETLRFGSFQFGPVVMRLARHYNNTDLVMMLFDKNYIEFFNQLSSVTIALDILFENGRYEDVVKLFDFVIEKYKFDLKYPSDFVTIYLAACYKINTMDAFDNSFNLIRSVQSANNYIKLRSIQCFLALAVNQNHPNIALEILQQLKVKNFSTELQSIRLLAFAKIGRFHEVKEIIRFYLKKDSAKNQRKVLFKETVDSILEIVNKTDKNDLIQEVQNLFKNLDESNLIEKDMTLDQSLTLPIVVGRNTRNLNEQTNSIAQKANN